MSFFIDIENQTGTRYGDGPISTASQWSHTRRLDRAGRIGFDTPATDERLLLLSSRRYARCRSPLHGTLADAGLGIIDTIEMDAIDRTLRVDGDDLMRELAMRSVGITSLKESDASEPNPALKDPIGLAAALAIVLDKCNNNSLTIEDWTLDTTTYDSTGSTTNGNNTITSVTNISNFTNRIGSLIYGAGIPAGTTVTAVGSTTITLSANATATAAGVVLERWRVYHDFVGESILQALIKVAELTGTHFRLGTGREIVWLYNVQPASGIRAVTDADPILAESNDEVCFITELSSITDTAETISRVHPFGSGSGSTRLALANSSHPGVVDPNITTRTAPTGYTLDLDFNFIERDDAETDYGFFVTYQTFNDVGVAVADTDPNYATALVNARNQLFDLALEYLRSHSYAQESYRLAVTKLDQEILPGETIRVIFRGMVDGYQWVDINADLLVLEATTEIDSTGTRTPGLVVSTIDRWPISDTELLMSLHRQMQQSSAHGQT